MIFETDTKKFYREVGKEKILIREAPPIENVEKYWKTVCSSSDKNSMRMQNRLKL